MANVGDDGPEADGWQPRCSDVSVARLGCLGPFAIAGVTFVLAAVLGAPTPGSAAEPERGMGTPPTRAEPAPPTNVIDAARESLFGDVYVEPTRWRELTYSTFFTEGWNEPWASPVTGGGAPGVDQRLRRRLLPPRNRDLYLIYERLRGER